MKRIGLIGAGMIASWHAERWQQLPVEIAGFYDTTKDKAESAASRFGGKSFDTLDALTREVDVVDVCTPTYAHKEGVLAAAEAGKPVVCEKPLARTLEDAEAIVSACEQAGVPLFVAQVVRFFPQYARAKAVLESGQLGRPGVMRTLRGGSFPRPSKDSWYADFSRGGGVIMDLAIHDLDFARWCFGEVKRVFARGLTFTGDPTRDHALITLRFANGAISHIEGSWAFPPGQFITSLEIAGDEGIVEWSSLEPPPVRGSFRSETDTGKGVSDDMANPLAPEDDPYYRELEHFLACLEAGTPFSVSPQDGVEAVRLSLAAIESLRTGKPVELAGFRGGDA